jgi:HSP20 family molecular chaperone IbpA
MSIGLDLFNPFDWDRGFYKFDRSEKDMNPYSIYNKEGEIVLVHNILGINKEDLKISTKTENHTSFIVIEGKSKDEITEKEYSINSRFSFDRSKLSVENATCSIKNGLLYITIPYKVEKQYKEKILPIE